MTEKKHFTRIICSNDEYTGSIYCNDDPLKIDTVCDLLNDLEDEKKQLKYNYDEKCVEYVGLEEQIENLLDFKDNVFNLINKKLKEADKGFEQTYDSWYQGQVDALQELLKELKGK